jgi:hypothetical protein
VTVKRRVEALEKAQPAEADLPLLILWKMRGGQCYKAADRSRSYTEADLPELEKTHRLLIFSFARKPIPGLGHDDK